MSVNESVDALRKKVDRVDEKIVELLNRRAALARKIGDTKGRAREQIYIPGREKDILQRISRLNRGPVSEQAIRTIYREVLSACRAIEAPIRVAYLGPEATFTHVAARENFGSSVSFVAMRTIPEVFQEVGQGRVKYGVVPVENSTEGVVTHTLDMLVEAESSICAEISLEIHLYLLSRSGRLEDVKRIVSHPQALAQCRRWLSTHCPKLPISDVSSTAEAAEMAAADESVAAVSSELTRDVYGLEVVKANIEDQINNRTRFFVIGDQSPEPTGDDKTSIVCSVKDEVGVLHRMLEPFAKNRINLTKIESRPLKHKPWEYVFFLDFRGHVREPKVQRVLKRVERSCMFVKILGSYPCAV